MRKLFCIIISLAFAFAIVSCSRAKTGLGLAKLSMPDFIKIENRIQIKGFSVDVQTEASDISIRVSEKGSIPIYATIEDSILTLTTEADGILLPEDCGNKFSQCSKLKFVDWSHFDMSKANDFGCTFGGCESLRYVDLTCLSKANVKSVFGMFLGCSSLRAVNLNSLSLKKLKNEDLQERSLMFFKCTSLEMIETPFEMPQEDDFWEYNERIHGCSKNECKNIYIPIRDGGIWKANDKGPGFVDWMNMPAKSILLFVKAPWNKDKAILSFKWFNLTKIEYRSSLDSIVIKTKIESKDKTLNVSSGDVPIYATLNHKTLTMTTTADVIYLPEFSRDLFGGFELLKFLNLNHFNTDYVTDMSRMFNNIAIDTLDLSSFNTSNVTDMSGMFATYDEGRHPLKFVNVSSFNTSKVTDMRYMFAFNMNLTSLDLSNFNTSNVTNMRGMFLWCYHLENLNISSFNTENVTNMEYMFGCCPNLKSLDLSHFSYKSIIQGNRKSNTNEERLFWTVPIF